MTHGCPLNQLHPRPMVSFLSSLHITARKQSLGQDNIFRSVFHSVHRGEGGSLPTGRGGGGLPLEGDLTPGARNQKSWRYASYWNAFLFIQDLNQKKSVQLTQLLLVLVPLKIASAYVKQDG